ncbi:hypothetical protein [Spiroplasma endosymbiont of 'Nebria riversi']|uniref:hypothetical protein n=1 Tax=Spiroplasma endosymbiont of 'Nebria riversi' TaxID=2792084 RepID=UPI001C04C37B|nr:hypothetical protein [Spiroplasma endosymbiont of 'Nebria riversi']
MLSFINKYKLQKYTTPPFPEGKTLFQYNGKIIDEFPEEAMLLVNNFDNLTKEIDLEKPWMHPNTKLWDNITFEHWLEMQDVTVDAKKMVGRIIAGDYYLVILFIFQCCKHYFMLLLMLDLIVLPVMKKVLSIIVLLVVVL